LSLNFWIYSENFTQVACLLYKIFKKNSKPFFKFTQNEEHCLSITFILLTFLQCLNDDIISLSGVRAQIYFSQNKSTNEKTLWDELS